MLKLNPEGSPTWQKTYGWIGNEHPRSIQQTSDGGYIVNGHTTSFGAGGYDIWILKLNSNGVPAWQKTYGGTDYDYSVNIQETFDGGYLIAGEATSFGAGATDIWLLKIDIAGNPVWQKTYGGIYNDYASSIQQTPDGGFILAGETN